MGRPKKNNPKIHITGRIPDYLYNIILKNQKDMGYATFNESLIEFICGGVNYKYLVEDNSQDNSKG